MIRAARCVDCDGRLDFRPPATWAHVEPGKDHAPMPEATGRDLPELADDDWQLPVVTESENRALWGDR